MRSTLVAALSFVVPLAIATASAQAPGTATSGIALEALSWTFKASPTPAPVITDGLYGAAGTQVLLGTGSLDTNRNGGLALSGYGPWDARTGLEASLFQFRSRSTGQGVSSSGQLGSVDLLLPFIDVRTGRERVTEISFSPLYAGDVQVALENRFGGAELLATRALPRQGAWATDLLGGVRYLRLRETYTIDTASPWAPPRAPDIWVTHDAFDATNDFYGATLGLRARYEDGPWFARATAKLSLGAMRQSVAIDGSLATDDYSDAGEVRVFPGGYFAQPNNIGTHSRTQFSVVPEGSLVAGYRVSRMATVFVGYQALYLRDVLRPGDQVERRINPTVTVSYNADPTEVPSGPPGPPFEYRTSSFWAHGLTAGVSVSFP